LHRGDFAENPEVEERYAIARTEKDVSRVRVCLKKTRDEKLVEKSKG
jgi:hypothetical protein